MIADSAVLDSLPRGDTETNKWLSSTFNKRWYGAHLPFGDAAPFTILSIPPMNGLPSAAAIATMRALYGKADAPRAHGSMPGLPWNAASKQDRLSHDAMEPCMFIVERSGFKLTKSFYIALIVLLLITGSFGVLLTMHIHFNPSKKRETLPKVKFTPAELPQAIPECDLPPLPDRQGPYDYKGHPYYLYPNGNVDGFTQRGWWRITFDEFKRYVDRSTPR